MPIEFPKPETAAIESTELLGSAAPPLRWL